MNTFIYFGVIKLDVVLCLAFFIKQAVKFHLYVPLENQFTKTYLPCPQLSRH